jgi:hypothetical protein
MAVISKGPKRVGVSHHSPEDGKRSSPRNGAFLWFLYYLTMDNVKKLSNPECCIPSSKLFKTSLFKIWESLNWVKIQMTEATTTQ